MSSPKSKLAGVALRLLVGVGLVGLVMHRLGASAGEVLARVAAVPAGVFLGALALDLGGQSLCAYRWALLGREASPGTSVGRFWALYFAGMFFSTCLPTSIGGDVVRVVSLGSGPDGLRRALASVFVDRNIGLGGLLVVGGVGAVVSGSSVGVEVSGRSLALPLWLAFAALSVGYALANALLVRRLPEGLLPARIQGKITPLQDALRAYGEPRLRGTLAWTLALSVVYQLSEVALVWLLAAGLGLPLSPWTAAAMVTFQAVAGLLPITINGLGVREAVFGAILLAERARLGDPPALKEQAVALSWLWLAVVVVSGLVGGVVYVASGVAREKPATQG